MKLYSIIVIKFVQFLYSRRAEILISDFQISFFQENSASLKSAPYSVVDGLGKGAFATVVEVVDTSGVHFAMKVINKARVSKLKEQERLRIELEIMTSMAPSPFLQRCHSAFESNNAVFFVLDLLGGGDLYTHLLKRLHSSGKGFTEDEGSVLLSEMVLGLEHLHSNGFIHRDLKVRSVSKNLHVLVLFQVLIHFFLSSRLKILCSMLVGMSR